MTAKLVVLLWAVTFTHHLYGGLSFGSPGRTVTAFVFTAILAITLWLHRLGAAKPWARKGYHSLVLIFWVALLGLYEGGYNHALYVILRQVDAGLAQRLYPAGGDALISNDLFFQGTGVLTLVAGIAVAVAWTRENRR
ncbi:MAG TPA: hypothetical protein VF062_04425 [Candidatus Limnocylindrales bacterium]